MESEPSPVVELNADEFIKNSRNRLKDYIDKHQYDTALFWADKLVSLTNAVEDVFWYAQTMFHTGQYHRAIHLLKRRKLLKSYSACRYLAAKCHYNCKEWQEALNMLDLVDISFTWASSTLNTSSSFITDTRDISGVGDTPLLQNCENSICLLRGKIYEAMDNRSLAADCYREALRLDVYCFEALDLLVTQHMLTSGEEVDLLDSLPFGSQCPPGEAEFLKGIYQTRIKKYNSPRKAEVPAVLSPIAENCDVRVSQAEQHLYNCNFRAAHAITTKVLNQDPYNSFCLPIHIACLVELKLSNDLFYLAHKLVNSFHDKCISWFAVGCYYMLMEKYSFARWYLSKATSLERAHGPSWLAFGHTFGMNNDHDQAMAAYFTASKIMRGCHLPILYIGLEYGLTNNPKLAERFFTQAQSIAPTDPFVLHEMGVIQFGYGELSEAEDLFKQALAQVQAGSGERIEPRWETLVNNLGHVARKQKRYEEALEWHNQALIICPQSASTYSAIGYVYALMGEFSKAVDYFHQALGLRKDDTFSTTMLTNSIEALMAEMAPCEGAVDDPRFQLPASSAAAATSSSVSSPAAAAVTNPHTITKTAPLPPHARRFKLTRLFKKPGSELSTPEGSGKSDAAGASSSTNLGDKGGMSAASGLDLGGSSSLSHDDLDALDESAADSIGVDMAVPSGMVTPTATGRSSQTSQTQLQFSTLLAGGDGMVTPTTMGISTQSQFSTPLGGQSREQGGLDDSSILIEEVEMDD